MVIFEYSLVTFRLIQFLVQSRPIHRYDLRFLGKLSTKKPTKL